MTAAWELSHAPQPYEITVYQMGWRLGGKGASGRNLAPGMGARIEEHGVHVWSGLYDNAFRMIREVYGEAARAPDAPLATWRDAFLPSEFIALTESYKGRWIAWPVWLPTNDQLPGEVGAQLALSPTQYLAEALDLARLLVRRARDPAAFRQANKAGTPVLPTEGLFGILLGGFGRDVLDVVLWLARLLCAIPGFRLLERLLLALVRWVMQQVWRRVQGRIDDDDVRRFWLSLNFLYANLAGAITDDVLRLGADVLDRYDYREWLAKYLIDDSVAGTPLTLNSPWALFLYDAEFAYVDGDVDKPNIGAGSALKTLIRMVFTWKGALLWKMQAGMGDTIFAPIYEVLKKRGVKFKFFHRATDIRLDPSGDTVASVELNVQATVQAGATEYRPLVDVNGLPCWPSEPDWAQLEDGQRLEGTDLEAYCGQPGGSTTIVAGKDFDHLVCAIPVGALPYVARDVIERKPRWKAMVDSVRTVRTQAAQVWLRNTTYQLGWHEMGRPLLACFHASPMNTWADMSHLDVRESWPWAAGAFPLSVQYFCGPMRDGPITWGPHGPVQDCAEQDQKRGDAAAKAVARSLLTDSIGWLWPQATQSPHDGKGPFDWNLLIDDRPQPGAGEARLDAQFFRGNVTPSERFTLSVKGSLDARLYPGQSGIPNLVLAGDWTRNDFNIGNVEATVMSGMLAANAISGYPSKRDIVGLGFLTSETNDG